jgi:hypothetical protein
MARRYLAGRHPGMRGLARFCLFSENPERQEAKVGYLAHFVIAY